MKQKRGSRILGDQNYLFQVFVLIFFFFKSSKIGPLCFSCVNHLFLFEKVLLVNLAVS